MRAGLIMFAAFMTHTWIAGTLVAIVAGVVGFFVVIRRAAFAAHVLPLGAFPGAAAASLLGVNDLLGLVAFAGLGVLGIDQLERWGRREVATALWLAASLALGTLLLSMTRQYSQQVYALLFGEVLGISAAAVVSVAVLSVLAIATMAILFRPLLLDSLSPELCQAAGASSRRMELAFLGVLAVSTAMVLPVVGALMVFSLMVGPASCARALTDEPRTAVLLSVGLSLATVWSAIALSYLSNWPVGFFVGTLGALAYAAGRSYRRFAQPSADLSDRHGHAT
jgi:zinc/manganese transport system permease protein